MNIRLLIGFLGILFIFSACGEKKQVPENLPKVLLTEEKMSEVLSEVQLIEAYLNEIPYNKRGSNDSDYVYYPLLFEKYKISKGDFLENLAYYSQNEETISSIYDKSIIILNKIKAKDLELRLEMKMDSIKDDSIRDQEELLRLEDSLRLKDSPQNEKEDMDQEEFEEAVNMPKRIIRKVKK